MIRDLFGHEQRDSHAIRVSIPDSIRFFVKTFIVALVFGPSNRAVGSSAAPCTVSVKDVSTFCTVYPTAPLIRSAAVLM